MVEGGSANRLAPEALDELLVVGVLLPQDLERRLALEYAFAGHIHPRHATAAQYLKKRVAVGQNSPFRGTHSICTRPRPFARLLEDAVDPMVKARHLGH